MIEATFPYGSTDIDRMRIRHDIVTSHAKNCPGGGADVERVYTMEYPRA